MIESRLAEQVLKDLAKKNGPQLTLTEALSMTEVNTDGYKIYVFHKGDVTFLAWKHSDNSVTTKIQCW